MGEFLTTKNFKNSRELWNTHDGQYLVVAEFFVVFSKYVDCQQSHHRAQSNNKVTAGNVDNLENSWELWENRDVLLWHIFPCLQKSF